jgi:DNA polymerase I-like protein with 3'-5' exonuclease and polymerase domains
MFRKIISLDIETEARDSKQEKGALHFKRNRMTIAGAVEIDEEGQEHAYTFRDYRALGDFLMARHDYTLVGHNIVSFDYKTLRFNGVDLRDFPTHDTMLLACAYTHKVSQEYLEWYEARRKEVNKTLPKGVSHREAGKYSLKTMDPYFNGSEPFWETPDNHDNETYVLEDCRRTLKLLNTLYPLVEAEGSLKFYKEKLMQWAFMLAETEYEGIGFDLDRMAVKEREASEAARTALLELDAQWLPHVQAYKEKQRADLITTYAEKTEAAIKRIKKSTPEKVNRTKQRYRELAKRAVSKIEPFNFDSPTQLTWLLKEQLGYDIHDYEGKESTGVEVLERLASEGHKDVETLLEYRRQKKLSTAFFPSYREYIEDGRIHCNFRLTGTRTGRLSSSGPNLQQQPPIVRDLFVATPGNVLITRDFSGIEPVVVAYYTQDPILCSLLVNGDHFHTENAPTFFPYLEGVSKDELKTKHSAEYAVVKALGLLLMYGGGWRRIQITCMKHGFEKSEAECKQIYRRYKDRYESVFTFKNEELDPMLKSGQIMQNLFGRSFTIAAQDVHMTGLNTAAQGSASDMGLQSAYHIRKEAPWIKLRLLVHDELVFEAPEERKDEAEEIIERHMTKWTLATAFGDLPLKVEGETARYWAK